MPESEGAASPQAASLTPTRLAAELRLAADRHRLYSHAPDALDNLMRRAAEALDECAAEIRALRGADNGAADVG